MQALGAAPPIKLVYIRLRPRLQCAGVRVWFQVQILGGVKVLSVVTVVLVPV